MQLYGQKSYGEIKSFQRIPLAKKYYLKLIKSMYFAITETIEIVDKDQLNRLINILKNGENEIKLRKNFYDIDQSFITTQTKLILQLLGVVPKRSSERNVLNRKENWKLNGLRQIQYVQNLRNKELIIFKIIQEKFMKRFGDWTDFVCLYHEKLENDPHKLVEYLKVEHPDIYNEII
jgi:hypothetical protein